MASTHTDITINHNMPLLSYNSTGWANHKIDFVKTLLFTHGVMICAVQEHFLLKQNLYKLQCFQGYEVFSLPAHKCNELVSGGRPSGGLALFYNQQLSKWATRLTVPNSYRVQGLKINLPNSKMLFVNAYLPNDPGNNNFDEMDLLNTLQDIQYLIDQVDESCAVIIMADLNTDFSRNSSFVQIVRNFFNENNLVTVWSKFDCAFTFYQERLVNRRTVVSKSKIDHFGVRAVNLDLCLEATPLHLAENFSFHEPIFLKIKCSYKLEKSSVENKNSLPKKPQWYKASKDNLKNYSEDLKHLLQNTPIDSDALGCRDLHCQCSDHKDSLDNMCENVLGCVSDAVRHHIPVGNNSEAKVIPGWNDHIQPYKEASQFWKAVWVSAGRPLDCELHKVYKNCRNKYKYAIRKVNNLQSAMRKDKFLESLLENKVNDILQEIKKQRSPNTKCANVIDGKSNSVDIANHFKNIYSNIYNTHSDRAELDKFILENNNKIVQSDTQILDKITPELVKNIILNFKNDKNDPEFDWKSNALKHGVDSVAEPLCDLLRALISHGHIPHIFLVCSLVPIVKDSKESKLSSNNYRLIAITSLILKLFDHILIYLSGPNLKPSNFQYGFQKGLSTSMCTWTLNETINYFRNRDSPVFMCLMDLTKAFDLVKLSVLFRKLAQRVHPLLIRFLVFSYIHQECTVSWDGAHSTGFFIGNGVRQGAVLSPPLFNIYIDSLFYELSVSGVGCTINNQYFGCVGYADDIALIAPCRSALQKMINIAKTFFDEHGIKISTNPDIKKTKTKILVYGINCKIAPLLLGDKQLPNVKTWKHLGVTLNTDENPAHDMLSRCYELIGKFHALRQEFPDQHPDVLMKLVKTYLFSLYGCPLWDIYAAETTKLWSTFHKIIKTTYSLPLATHRFILPDVSNCEHMRRTIIRRFIKFSLNLSSSENPNIRLLHRIQGSDPRSVYGRNIANICKDAGVLSLRDLNPDNININPIPNGDEWKIPFIKDLLAARSDDSDIFLNTEDINSILDFVCCK